MYAGRLLLVGLLEASVAEASPPLAPPVQEHVQTVESQVVVGDAPPQPVASVVEAAQFHLILVTSNGSRTATADRSPQGTENVDFTLPNNTGQIILGTGVGDSNGANMQIGDNATLQFRRDGQPFQTVVSGSGEVRAGFGTILVDGDTVTPGEQLTTGNQPGDFQNGREVEDVGVGAYLTNVVNQHTEFQWALNFREARPETTYDFRVLWETVFGGVSQLNYISIITAPAVIYRHLAPVVAGDGPPLPEASVVEAVQFHVAVAAAPTISHQVVEPTLVRGDPPPVPAGDVLQPSGHQTELHPTAPTFNQHVQGQVAEGEPLPLPAGDVLQPSGHQTDLHPAAPTFNQHVAGQVVEGEPLPLPAGDVAQPSGHQTDLHPTAPTFNQHVAAQVATGDAPPFPDSAVVQGRVPGPTPAAPTDISHEVIEPTLVGGDAPPLPTGDVAQPVGHQTELHPTAPTFNQHVGAQVVAGDEPPLPQEDVAQATPPGPAAVAAPDQSLEVITSTVVLGEGPPVPVSDVEAVGQFHSGAAAVVPAVAGGYFAQNFFN